MAKTQRQSLDEVFCAQRPLLLRTLSRIVGNAAAAEDLVHETYVRVCAAVRERPVEHVQPFLYQTARNLAFDHLRAERRRGALLDPRLDGDEVADVASCAPTQETAAHDRQMVERLQATLARLTPRQRAVFVQAKVHGRSYDAIAAGLRVSKSTVQKDLTAAMGACLRTYERSGRG